MNTTRRLGLVLAGAVLVAATVVAAPPPPPAAAGDAGRAWLALGDSYSSGEGIAGTTGDDDKSGENTQGRDCRRATGEGTEATAWSVGAYNELKDDLGLDEIALVACTGATTDELDDQIGEARTRFSRDRWDLVTFSFGGNDIGFADLLYDCLDIPISWDEFDLSIGCDTPEGELHGRINDLRTHLGAVYDDVADTVEPGGDVIVVGYPQLTEEVARWDAWRRNVLHNCEGILSGDIAMLRSVGGYLNQQIALAVQDADTRHGDDGVHFHFLDISQDPYEYSDNATDRHALCSQDPWLNGVTSGVHSGDVRLMRSFHPMQVGHTNTARVLATYLHDNITFDDAPAVSDLTVDDMMNVRLPDDTCGGFVPVESPIQLVDGTVPGIPDGQGFIEAQPDRTAFGDLDGDGADDAVVTIICNGGGSAAWFSAEVYLAADGYLGHVPFTDVEAGEFWEPGIGGAEISDGLIWLHWSASTTSDAHCCPSIDVRGAFFLDGGTIVPVNGSSRAGVDGETPFSIRGVGAIEAGMTLWEAEQASGLGFRIQGFDSSDAFGSSCFHVTIPGIEDLSFLVESPDSEPVSDPRDAVIGRASAYEGGRATLSGIRIGSTTADVLAAYPGHIEREPHEYVIGGEYLFYVPDDAADASFRVMFETDDDGVVTAIHSGQMPAVSYVEGCL